MSQQLYRIRRDALRLGAALGLAAGVTLVAAPGPARAGDNNDPSFYDQTFGRVLEGLGFQKGGGADIQYRERPPLVLPNGRELPPPEKSEVAAAPNWPKDPDVKRRKLEEQLEKNRNISDEREREQNPLRRDQLTPGPGSRGAQASSSGPGRSGDKDFGEVLSPSALGYNGGLLGKMFNSKDEDKAQFTGEPPRADLTDPPVGYQTPSPNQPYGVGGKYTPKAEDDYQNRGELKR